MLVGGGVDFPVARCGYVSRGSPRSICMEISANKPTPRRRSCQKLGKEKQAKCNEHSPSKLKYLFLASFLVSFSWFCHPPPAMHILKCIEMQIVRQVGGLAGGRWRVNTKQMAKQAKMLIIYKQTPALTANRIHTCTHDTWQKF